MAVWPWRMPGSSWNLEGEVNRAKGPFALGLYLHKFRHMVLELVISIEAVIVWRLEGEEIEAVYLIEVEIVGREAREKPRFLCPLGPGSTHVFAFAPITAYASLHVLREASALCCAYENTLFITYIHKHGCGCKLYIK